MAFFFHFFVWSVFFSHCVGFIFCSVILMFGTYGAHTHNREISSENGTMYIFHCAMCAHTHKRERERVSECENQNKERTKAKQQQHQNTFNHSKTKKKLEITTVRKIKTHTKIYIYKTIFRGKYRQHESVIM